MRWGSVDDALAALQRALDETGHAIGAASEAESEAEDLVGQMTAAAVVDKAEEFQAFQDAVEKARVHLDGGAELLRDAIALGETAKGSRAGGPLRAAPHRLPRSAAGRDLTPLR